jgi:kinesin family protein C2/C3
VHDLLSDNSSNKRSAPLEIRQSSEGGNGVPGLKEMVVTSTEQVLELMAKGADNRAVGSHDMNEHSSRSHSILNITCVGTPKTGVNAAGAGGGGGGKAKGGKKDLPMISSKLHLIDLAGSERVSKTDAVGERLKEAQAINKSLSALGDVISALGGKKGTHVPYRNSKLTFLLQDSLSGSSKVLMFCNVSPASYNLGETVCTLTFAARCRNVELGAAKKAGTEGAEVKKLRAQVQKLQDDLADAKEGGGGGGAAAASPESSPSKVKSPSKR